ncbi:RDD family protein [Arenimonas sp. MALMAid1274]|uniref:RDD family protein n=1 Tax=Arenimonas sp. MALMAid1274 TaxID=3411630 RepID=UPI003BA2407B
MQAPAGFWRRYAAYSLDAAAVVLLASPLLAWRGLRDWPDLTTRFEALQMRLLERLEATLAEAGDLFAAVTRALSDPALREGITSLAEALARLLGFGAVVLFAVAALWFIPTEASRAQASPGKRAAGLWVTDLGGQACGRGRIVLRFVAGVGSWLSFNLGHAMAAWTPGKRALHDYIAGTRVQLAPGADPAMPRWARSWLLLQAALFCGFNAYVLLAYAALLWEAVQTGLP